MNLALRKGANERDRLQQILPANLRGGRTKRVEKKTDIPLKCVAKRTRVRLDSKNLISTHKLIALSVFFIDK